MLECAPIGRPHGLPSAENGRPAFGLEARQAAVAACRERRPAGGKYLIASDHYPDIRWGVKFTAGNVGFENKVLTIPYYTAFLLRRLLERWTPTK